MVIPVMDIIDDALDENSKSTNFRPCIRQATTLAKATLNRYYEKTDLSDVYRIAMVMHPAHKLQYFKNAEWENDWISVAEELVKQEFTDNYATLQGDDTASDAGDAPVSPKVRPLICSFKYILTTLIQASKNMFDNILSAKSTVPAGVDEFTSYLEEKVENVGDPIAWWLTQRNRYPRLSKMALDYLLIPGQ